MTTQASVNTGSRIDGDDASPQPAEKKKRGKKKLIMIGGLILVLAIAGGVVMRGGGGASASPVPGEVIKLEPIFINLSDGHYLKLGIALQASASAPKEGDGSMALDAAIAVFSNAPMTDLSDTATRARLKAELVAKVNHAYEGHFYDVYFTEFVMQ